MAVIYTPEMVARLRELSPIDNAKAEMFAAEFANVEGMNVHSVRAKAVRTDGIEYVKKPKARKDGTPVEQKSEIVEEIAELCGSDADSFESLGNATRLVLVAIRDALAK